MKIMILLGICSSTAPVRRQITMASITKRNGRYHVRIRKTGFPTQCNSFSLRKDAERWTREIERLNENGYQFGCSETVSDLLDRYLKEITPQKRCAKIERYRIRKLQSSALASITLDKLRPQHIATYRDERLKHVAPSTCIWDLSILSHAISTAIRDWGYALADNPVEKVRKPVRETGRNRRLKIGEQQNLLEACRCSYNPYLAPLVEFAIETAMRRGELLSLRWEHVFQEDQYVHLPNTKNGSSRDVPLSNRARAILANLPASFSELVFPIHFEALKGLWTRACRRVEISDLRFHDLRHEATTRLFEKGLNVMEVAAITGHKDLRMLQRYTHLKPETIASKLN